MHSSHSSDLCSIHLSQVSVVASTKHLGTGLDAAIAHELVERMNSLLMELASSAVTLNGRLNTSMITLAYAPFSDGFVTHVSKEMSL